MKPKIGDPTLGIFSKQQVIKHLPNKDYSNARITMKAALPDSGTISMNVLLLKIESVRIAPLISFHKETQSLRLILLNIGRIVVL